MVLSRVDKMRFRWLGNSCVEIFGFNHVLIDPNYLIEPEPKIDYVLITHEHPDHISKEKVPEGDLFTTKTVLEKYNLKGKVAEPEMLIDNIEVFESFCLKAKESLGFLIKDTMKILHCGDSIEIPEVKTDILFVPVFRDFHHDIFESCKKSGAKFVYPIHFSKEKIRDAQDLGKLVEEVATFKILEVGEWVEV